MIGGVLCCAIRAFLAGRVDNKTSKINNKNKVYVWYEMVRVYLKL